MQYKIQEFINECDICRLSKYDRNPLKLKFNHTPTPSRPLEIVHIDSVTFDKQKFLTIVDAFSKYAQAYPLLSLQRTEIIDKLLMFFGHHGCPKIIVSDNGGEFKNDLLQEFLRLHNIDSHFISSQHPQSNGIVERFHSTLREHYRIFNNRDNFKNESTISKIRYSIFAYNNTKHSVTKLTPFELLNGHIESNSPFNINIEQQVISQYNQTHRDKTKLLYEQIHEKMDETKRKIITKRNETREDPPDIPEKVYVKNRQKCSKSKNQYKQETLHTVDKDRKTALIVPKAHQTVPKIHLDNIKRPPKTSSNPNPIPGPSSALD